MHNTIFLLENNLKFPINYNKIIEIKNDINFLKCIKKKFYWNFGKIGLLWKFKFQNFLKLKKILFLRRLTNLINLSKMILNGEKNRIGRKFFFL